MRTALLIACLLACGPGPGPGTGRPDLSDPAAAQLSDARQAIDLGRTADAALYDAFTRGYQLAPAETIDRAEVVTAFRRAVMIAREHARQGDSSFSDQDLSRAMAPFAGLVTFIVEARLHPLHTYAEPPHYDLYIETGPATKPLGAQPLTREPVFPQGMIGPGNAMVGVRLEATFQRAEIDAARAPVLVVTDDQANVLWKARIDLSRYR